MLCTGRSDFITSPGRTNAFLSLAQEKGLNLTGRAIGAIPFGTGKVIFGQNGAGNYYAKNIIEGIVANKAVAKGFSKSLGTVSSVKLDYDIGTYVYSAYLCKGE